MLQCFVCIPGWMRVETGGDNELLDEKWVQDEKRVQDGKRVQDEKQVQERE